MGNLYAGSFRRVNFTKLLTQFAAIVVFSFFFLLPNKSLATHAAGSDLTYKWISGNTYQVTVSFYRDCAGVAAPTNITLNVKSNSCSRTFNVTLNKIGSTGQEITFPCNPASTLCNGGSGPGIQQYIYQGNVTLPLQCTDWVFSYSVCCRNCAISTIVHPSPCNSSNTTPELYVEATLNNIAAPSNNSPRFSNVPQAYLCANQAFTYNHGVIDDDGDSLSYSFIAPKTSSGGTVTYVAPFSATNFMSSTPAPSINAITGDISVTPTLIGEVAVCAVLIKEYRNNVQIGSVIRDMQFRVTNCNPNLIPTATGINGSSNFSAVICPGSNLCFNITSNDANPADVVTMTWNAGITGATFTTAGTPHPTGTFCWTPTLLDARTQPYTFTVMVQDNACPNNAFQIYSFSISVPPHTITFTSPLHNGFNISCNGGNDGQATANVTGGNAPYTYSWSNGQTAQTATGLVAGTYTVTINDADGCPATNSVTLTQPTVISLSTTPVTSSCFGGNDGSMTSSVSGGISPYTYAWSNGQTTANASGLTGGQSYTVTVTDANGCTATSTKAIPQPTQLTATISSSTNVSCNGEASGAIDLTPTGGTPGYTYKWSSGPTTQDLTNVPAGTYTVTVTDSKGCTTTKAQTITEPGVVVPLITSTSVNGVNVACFGDATGEASVSVTGGTGPFTYTWSTGATDQNISGLSAGTVSVTVTDANGCKGNGSFTLTEPAAALDIALDSIITYAGGFGTSCNGQSDGGIFVTVSGGTTPYTYSWSNGETTEDITGLTGGTYTLTVVDFNGCSDTASFTVTPPPPFAVTVTSPVTGGGTNIGCHGETSGSATGNPTGGASPYTYNWNNGATTQTITGLGVGTYNVTVLDANGCSGSGTITLTEPDTLVPLISAVTVNGGNNIACFGGSDASASVSVTGGTAPYTYAWSNGATADSVENLSAGLISVTVTDVNNCSAIASFTITQPPAVTLSASASVFNGGYNVGCHDASNGSIDLTPSGGTPGYTFVWSPGGETTEDISGLLAGTYNVTVEDANGCTATTSATLTEPDSVQSTAISPTKTGGFNVSCAGSTDGSIDLTVTGGASPYTYNWNNSETTEDLTGIGAGTYSVTITDANGCTDTTSVTLIEPDPIDPSVVSPTYSGGTNISCNGLVDGSIDLTVTGGTTPYSYSWSNGETTEDLTELGAGTYTVTITDGSGCTNATATITLTEPDTIAPSATISQYNGYNIACGGSSTGSINLTVTGGSSPYTYVWSINDVTTEDVTGLKAGTYSVTITDANGCVGGASYTLAEPDTLEGALLSPTYAGGFNVTCAGNDGSINLTITGGASPYTYIWSPGGETTEDLTGLGQGTYKVTVTDANGCSIVDSITLTQTGNIQVALAAPTFNGEDEVSCKGSANGSIDATVTGGASPYEYFWSNGETTEDVSGLTAGTYTITVVDANGCSAVKSETLTEPDSLKASNIVPTDVSCFGGSNGAIDLTPEGGTFPGYSYEWETGATTQDVSGLAAGTYTITLTDANGCTAIDSATIVEPTAIDLSLTGTDTLGCANAGDGNIDLTVTGGTPGYTYSWSPGGETTEDISGLSGSAGGTVYTVVVTDANSCTATETFTIIQLGALVVTATPSDVTGCHGDSTGSVTTSVTGGATPFTYSWSDGSTTQDITGVPAGSYTVSVTDNNGCSGSASATVGQPPLLTVALSPSDVKCNGANDGFINATPSGGTPVYLYSWSNGATTQNISGLGPNKYYLTVTDRNGCTTIDSATIAEPPALFASTTGTDTLGCGATNGTIDLTVTGGTPTYSYSWSNGATTEDVSGLSGTTGGTTYSVTVTDANGCTTTASFTITQFGLITVVANPIDVLGCFGDSTGSISLTITGGVAPFEFNWSNGSTVQDLTGLKAGSYSVTVTDVNGCTGTGSATINQPTQLQATTGVTNVTCNGNGDGAIDLTVTGGTSGYTYSWDSGPTTEDISGLVPGTYHITVVDANGCSTTNSAVVIEPDTLKIAITGTDTLGCSAAGTGTIDVTVTGGTPGYTYSWSGGETTEDLSGLSGSGSGTTYSVTVRDGNGCINVANWTIVQLGAITVSTTPSDVTGCHGDSTGSVDATVTGGSLPYNYQWTNGATIEDITGIPAGTYTVTVTDNKGCSGTSTATVGEPAALNASITVVKQPTCADTTAGELDLTVSGGTPTYAYSWSNGETTEDVSGLQGGAYVVTVTDDNGCTTTAFGSLNAASPLHVSAVLSDPACGNPNSGAINITVTGGTGSYTYNWSPGGATTQDLGGLVEGDYDVTVTDAGGCSATATYTLTTVPGIKSTSAVTRPSCNGASDAAIDITVTGGVGPYTYFWTPGGATTEDISGLTAGTYTAHILDSKGCQNTTVVIISETPKPEFTAGGVTDACSDVGNLNGTLPAGYTGSWTKLSGVGNITDPTSPKTSVTGLEDGASSQYVWTITNGTCTFSDTATLNTTFITVNAGADFETCDSIDVQLAAVLGSGSGEWSSPDGDIKFTDENSPNSKVSGLAEGENILIWTVTDGNCEGFDTVIVTRKPFAECGKLEMPTGFSPNGDGANDKFVIHGIGNYPDNSFRVFNRWGNVVYEREDYQNEWDGSNKSGGALPDGTYFVILKINDSKGTTLTGYVDMRR